MTHEAFASVTPFEIMIWFWEDYYKKNPLEAKREEDGDHIQFYSDDPLIDKWERELAQGIMPDLTEGMSPEHRAKEKKALEKLKQKEKRLNEETAVLGDGFADDYSSEAAELSQMPVLGK